MSKIIVSVSDLLDRANELQEGGMKYVELSIVEPEERDDFPPCLWFRGYEDLSSRMEVEFDGIDGEKLLD